MLGMDVVRTDLGRNAWRRRIIVGGGALIAVSFVTFGFARLQPAAPQISRSALWMDTVRRGPLVSEVRAHGSLVPEQVRWITAASDGRVEQIAREPGTAVDAQTPLLVLSNAELAQSALDAESHLREADAGLADLAARLESQVMQQRAAAVSIRSEQKVAALQLAIDEKLALDGLASPLALNLSRTRADDLSQRATLADEQLRTAIRSRDAQLAGQRARVEQARTLAELRRVQIAALEVRSGIDGVLQEVLVEPGQRVTAGTKLAKVANALRMKAELKIPEVQARDLTIGQKALIDTRNGIVPGHVVRIDPAVQNHGVTVDVALDGPPPPGARPDLSIEGTIETARLPDVLYVTRPSTVLEKSRTTLFRLSPDGHGADRVEVELGAGSATAIQIVRGLHAGDRVILSDTAQWDESNHIRID
jgi:HlyD family secretion protein